MKDELLKHLLESTKIPSLPIMYGRITDAINNPRSSIADIGNIIKTDTGLTARLLRLANSAYYGSPNEIDNIIKALVIIGTRELRDFVLGTTILSIFKGIPEDLVSMKSFWKHCIACGVAAKILATFRGDANAERLFVVGLLHDVGRLFIFKHLADKSRNLMTKYKSSGQLLFNEEKTFLGFDHAEVGCELLKNWNIPANIQEMVSYHHRPSEAKHYPVETSIIHVADIIVHAIQLGKNGERFVPPLDPQAWSALRLAPSMLPPIIDQMDRQFDEVVQSIYQA